MHIRNYLHSSSIVDDILSGIFLLSLSVTESSILLNLLCFGNDLFTLWCREETVF